MSFVGTILSAIRRLVVVLAIAMAFLFGMATTVYLSLRSSEVKVPDVMGKDRFEAEAVLGKAGLNYRVRATRPSVQVKPDTVVFQLPRAGDVVKVGQTVAMDISRATKEGERSQVSSEPSPEEHPPDTGSTTSNENTRRNRNSNKNTNENASNNGNVNVNRSANVNRKRATEDANGNENANSNTRPARTDSSPVNSNTRPARTDNSTSNSNNRNTQNSNSVGGGNQNINRRPESKPSPPARRQPGQP